MDKWKPNSKDKTEWPWFWLEDEKVWTSFLSDKPDVNALPDGEVYPEWCKTYDENTMEFTGWMSPDNKYLIFND